MSALAGDERQRTLETRGHLLDLSLTPVYAENLVHSDHEKNKALARFVHERGAGLFVASPRGHVDTTGRRLVNFGDGFRGMPHHGLVACVIAALVLLLSGAGADMQHSD